MFLITVGPSSDRRRQGRKTKSKTQKEREPATPVPDGKRRWVDRKQEHAEQTIEKGDEGIAEQEPQAKLFPGRPLVPRLAAKRHDDSGKSGQRHRNLSGGRQGFTWFHRFGLDGFSWHEQTRISGGLVVWRGFARWLLSRRRLFQRLFPIIMRVYTSMMLCPTASHNLP